MNRGGEIVAASGCFALTWIVVAVISVVGVVVATVAGAFVIGAFAFASQAATTGQVLEAMPRIEIVTERPAAPRPPIIQEHVLPGEPVERELRADPDAHRFALKDGREIVGKFLRLERGTIYVLTPAGVDEFPSALMTADDHEWVRKAVVARRAK